MWTILILILFRKCAGTTGCASMRTIRTLILSLKCRPGRKQWLKEEKRWRNQENRRNQEEKRKISSWVHNSKQLGEQEPILNRNCSWIRTMNSWIIPEQELSLNSYYFWTGIILKQLLFLNRNYLWTFIISEQELQSNINYSWTEIIPTRKLFPEHELS